MIDGEYMGFECVLCGREINEDNANFIEQLAKSNYKNAYYLSNDIKMQHRPLCDDEFVNPDGFILIFGENLNNPPVSFKFKQHIIYNIEAYEHTGISYEQMKSACEIAYKNGADKIGDLKLLKYNRTQSGTLNDENLNDVKILAHLSIITNDVWGKPAYFVLKVGGNLLKHMNIYLNDSPDDFCTILKVYKV